MASMACASLSLAPVRSAPAATRAARPALAAASSSASVSLRAFAVRAPLVSRKRAALVLTRAELPETAEPAPVAKPSRWLTFKNGFGVDKGNYCKVIKDKYVNSVEALASHKMTGKGALTGNNYIFESRGEVLDVREFSKGTYAFVAFVGVPSSPCWLPLSMLQKVEKLEYQRF